MKNEQVKRVIGDFLQRNLGCEDYELTSKGKEYLKEALEIALKCVITKEVLKEEVVEETTKIVIGERDKLVKQLNEELINSKQEERDTDLERLRVIEERNKLEQTLGINTQLRAEDEKLIIEFKTRLKEAGEEKEAAKTMREIIIKSTEEEVEQLKSERDYFIKELSRVKEAEKEIEDLKFENERLKKESEEYLAGEEIQETIKHLQFMRDTYVQIDMRKTTRLLNQAINILKDYENLKIKLSKVLDGSVKALIKRDTAENLIKEREEIFTKSWKIWKDTEGKLAEAEKKLEEFKTEYNNEITQAQNLRLLDKGVDVLFKRIAIAQAGSNLFRKKLIEMKEKYKQEEADRVRCIEDIHKLESKIRAVRDWKKNDIISLLRIAGGWVKYNYEEETAAAVKEEIERLTE